MQRVMSVSSWWLTCVGLSLLVVAAVLVPSHVAFAQGYGACDGDGTCNNGCNGRPIENCSLQGGCKQTADAAHCGGCLCRLQAGACHCN